MVSIPFTMSAQEKEKKVRIKTVKVIDGEKVVTDTIIIMDSDDDLKEIMTEIDIETDAAPGEEIMLDVIVETVGDGESGEKIIIIKSVDGEDVKVIKSQGGTYSYTFDSDVDIDKDFDGGKKVIIVSPHSGHKNVIKWSSEDGEEFEIEHKIIMKELEGELEALEEMHLELEHFETIEHMVFLKKMEAMEELENMEIRVIRPPHPPHHEMFFDMHHSDHGVTDGELRDAGIKNRADRLAIENINLNIDDGVVDLSFSLKTEGSPKIVVYNFFGDKVFSGKPELMNGNYELKIDLSAKQHGVYYLQIVQKNSSFTEKLNL